jgi:hypothetical protein
MEETRSDDKDKMCFLLERNGWRFWMHSSKQSNTGNSNRMDEEASY